MGAACCCFRAVEEPPDPVSNNKDAAKSSGVDRLTLEAAMKQQHNPRAASRTSSIAGSVYFDADDGDWQNLRGDLNSEPPSAANPQLDAHLAAGQLTVVPRAISRSSFVSGTGAFEDAVSEMGADSAWSSMPGSDDAVQQLGSESKEGASLTQAVNVSNLSHASEAAGSTKARGEPLKVGTAGAHQQLHPSSPHLSSMRTSLARMSLTFGSSKSHEVAPIAERVDPALYDSALLELQRQLFGSDASTAAELPLLPVAPWNRKPGYLGHLTADQEAALAKLRDCFPASSMYHTDHDLLRFLRARDFHMDAARSMYNDYVTIVRFDCCAAQLVVWVQYREKLMVSPAPVVRPLLGEWPLHVLDMLPQRPAFATERMQRMMDFFVHAMLFHTDRLGRPVVYLRLADMITNGMSTSVPLAERILMQTASMETNRLMCLAASRAAGHHIEEIMQVVDLGGVSVLSMMIHQRSQSNQAEWQHNADYNPESLGKIVIINAPYGSGGLWKVASMVLPPRTREKVCICSSKYESELRKLIDVDNLPSCYGGNVQFEWQKHKDVGFMSK